MGDSHSKDFARVLKYASVLFSLPTWLNHTFPDKTAGSAITAAVKPSSVITFPVGRKNWVLEVRRVEGLSRKKD